MTFQTAETRSVVLRLEFSIADAVRHRGLLAVMRAAIHAWWQQHPRSYSDVPAHLRADVGLDAVEDTAHWTGIDLHAYRLQPPDRRWP